MRNTRQTIKEAKETDEEALERKKTTTRSQAQNMEQARMKMTTTRKRTKANRMTLTQ